jgi:hypothetical protein
MALFARDTALPRFRLVAATLPGGVEETRVADRATLARAVFVPPDAEARLAPGLQTGGTALPLEIAAERFVVETDAPAPALLVTSQKRFPPYWRTYLDGREIENFRANGLFLGIPVPAGRHRVEGRFVVPRLEVAVSLLGLAALLAVLIRAKLAGVRA